MVRTQYRPPLEIQDFRDFPKVLFLFRLPLVYLTVSEPYNRIRHPNPADSLVSERVISTEEANRPRRAKALVALRELLDFALPRFTLIRYGGLQRFELSRYPLEARVLRGKVLAQRAQLRRLRFYKLDRVAPVADRHDIGRCGQFISRRPEFYAPGIAPGGRSSDQRYKHHQRQQHRA